MPDQFLKDLLLTPGTSGQEGNIQKVVRNYVNDFADEVKTDVFGNLSATVNPQGPTTILLDAHCDQIGLIVKHIDNLGFIRVNPIGGWDLQILLGQRLVIHSASGPIPGVIARKPIHLLDPEERKTVPKMK
jgi:endoglucanase